MLRPFVDLLKLVQAEDGMRVVDLGCGTGTLTLRLHETLRATSTTGIDRSLAMLDRTASSAGKDITFESGDIEAFPPDDRSKNDAYTLVFSNVALGRVRNHGQILERWTRALAPGGQLALQFPARSDAVWRSCADEVAREPPFAAALGGTLPLDQEALSPVEYARLLAKLGYREQHVRLQVYGHWLLGPEDVIDWAAQTVLTRYRVLLGSLYGAFLERYRRKVAPQLGDSRPFFFPTERILLWGRK